MRWGVHGWERQAGGATNSPIRISGRIAGRISGSRSLARVRAGQRAHGDGGPRPPWPAHDRPETRGGGGDARRAGRGCAARRERGETSARKRARAPCARPKPGPFGPRIAPALASRRHSHRASAPRHSHPRRGVDRVSHSETADQRGRRGTGAPGRQWPEVSDLCLLTAFSTRATCDKI